MKIGFYVQRVASAPGFENVVSAHVQLPLHTIRLLHNEGHEVHLITTEYGPQRSLPNFLPADIPLHTVAYGARQGDNLVMFTGRKRGIRPFKLIQQLIQFKHIADKENFDILHFSGSSNVVYLASILKAVGVKTPIVLTINISNVSKKFPGSRFFWKSISAIITSTKFLKDQLQEGVVKDVEIRVIKHGTIRNLSQTVQGHRACVKPHRVLFWRDPSEENGADICLSAFEKLAPKYPDISFDLAIRPHWAPVPNLKQLPLDYSNIHVYEFPYPNDITLEKLMAEAICILLPFRELSTHPQFAVLESLEAGCAVITTELDSNFELIDHKKNGYLVPVGNIEATVESIEMLLNERELAKKIGEQATEEVVRDWNWESYISEILGIYSSVLDKA